MAHADVLYDFVLMVAKFVKIAIDSGKIHILVKVVFQIFHRSSLARWICQTGFHKLADLAGLMEGVEPKTMNSAGFIAAIRERLEGRLA